MPFEDQNIGAGPNPRSGGARPARSTALTQSTAAQTFARQVRRKRLAWGLFGFMLCVVLPTTLGWLYYTSRAADQFVTEFHFAVRGRQQSGSDPFSALLGGASPLSTMSDSYIVVDYIESLEMVRQLDLALDLKAIYAKPTEDWIHRFEPTGKIEDLLDYWQSMISANFDLARGIVSVRVWSFDPDDSRRIAGEVLRLTKALVDQISREARDEALSYANEQVTSAAEGTRRARLAIQDFRNEQKIFDPTADAQRIYENIALLEKQIIDLQTEIETQQASIGDASAAVRKLKERQAAARRQLQGVEESIDDELPEQSRVYESLQAEYQIALERYTAALTARAQAESVATQRQVYLSVFNPPATAEASLYPDRPWVMFYVFLTALGGWAVFYIVVLNIRDAMV